MARIPERRSERHAVSRWGPVILTGANGGTLALTAVTQIVAARALGPSALGKEMALFAVCTTISLLINFGSNTFLLREISNGVIGPGAFVRKFSGKVYATIAVSAGLAVVVGSMEDWVAGLATGVLLLVTTALLNVAVPLNANLLFLRSGVASVSGRATSVLLAVILSAADAVSNLFVIAMAGGSAVTVFLAIAIYPAGFRRASMTIRYWLKPSNPWRGGGGFGPASVALATAALDAPILVASGGSYQAGVYSAVARWTQPIALIGSSFSQAKFPGAAAARGEREAWRALTHGSGILVFTVVICVAIAAGADTLVLLLLGDQFAGSGPILAVLSLAVIPATAAAVLLAFLNATGHERFAGRTLIGGSLAQLVLVASLGGRLGAYAGAIGFASSQLIVVLLLSLKSRRVLARPSPRGD